jgi:flagellar protein FliJ
MARFRFRLQTVLEHRQRLEEMAQLEHAQAQASQAREEGVLARLKQAEDDGFSVLERQRMTGKLDIESLQLGMGYLDALKVQIQRQDQVVDRVRRHTASRREALVDAMQQRKVLDRLKEKQQQDHQAAESHREAVALDEMVTMRHAGKMIEARRAASGATYAR